MMRYAVPVDFVFQGYFNVEAASPREAARLVKTGCSLRLGETIRSDLEDCDWHFADYPYKRVGNMKNIVRADMEETASESA